MLKSLFRKVLVLGLIVIFVLICIIPSMGGIILKINDLHDNKILYYGINSNDIIFYVGGNGAGNFTRIQDAIDNASDGDTIFVYDDSSPYYENIKIDKSINLFGETCITTHIIGNFLDNSIYVNANFVNIKGFHISNGNLSGIKLFECEDCSITDNIIDSNKRYGIHLSRSSNNNISGNHIHLNYNGIKLYSKSNFNNIRDNTIENNENGTYLEHSSKNTINGNLIKKNYYGLKLYSKSKSNSIKSNTISNNNVGIFIGGTVNPTFIFNILLDGSIHNKIIKNNFLNNEQDAFFQNSRLNRWSKNYYNRPRISPKLIFGEIYWFTFVFPLGIAHYNIPWIPKIDWHPALRPYDI